jgi:hypothetical protein
MLLWPTTRTRRCLIEQHRVGCVPVHPPATDVVALHIDGAGQAHESSGSAYDAMTMLNHTKEMARWPTRELFAM